MAPRRKLQRKLLLIKLIQNWRRRRKEMLQKILFLLTVRRMLLLEVFFIAAIPISSEKTPDRFLVFLFILFFIASQWDIFVKR